MNGRDEARILDTLAVELDATQPRTATAARNGATALRNEEARQPYLRALLAELGAADVRQAVVKARKLKEANDGEMRDVPLFPQIE